MVTDNKRELYRGVDDGWTRAMELVVTPFLAGAIGFVIDGFAGTLPLFTIVAVLMAVVATFVKMYYTYAAEMQAHEAGSPWAAARSVAPGPVPGVAETTAPSRHHGSAVRPRSPAGLGGS